MGITKQFVQSTLETAITLSRGGDPRTIENWTNNLLRLGFIKRIKRPLAIIYELDLTVCPELLNEVTRIGQKKLM